MCLAVFFRISGVARLDAEVDLAAAGLVHLGQQFGVDPIDAGQAAPAHADILGDEVVEDRLQALHVDREQIIHEVEVANVVPVDQFSQLGHDVLGSALAIGAAHDAFEAK